MERAERQWNCLAEVKILFPFLKIKQHQTNLTSISGVADGELQAEMVVGNLVKIPFLYPPWRRFDGVSAVDKRAFS